MPTIRIKKIRVYFTEGILGLQWLKVKKIQNIEIHCQLVRKEHGCQNCGTITDKINYYQTQIIKYIPAVGKLVSILSTVIRIFNNVL